MLGIPYVAFVADGLGAVGDRQVQRDAVASTVRADRHEDDDLRVFFPHEAAALLERLTVFLPDRRIGAPVDSFALKWLLLEVLLHLSGVGLALRLRERLATLRVACVARRHGGYA